MTFKDRLKEARLAKEYTQEQLANIIGVAKSTYTGYEKGNREPNMLTISKIIDALNIDANYLYQDEMGSNYPARMSYDEIQHIKKYRVLDEHGQEMVNFVLEKEYDRSQIQNKTNNVVPMVTKESTELITDVANPRDDIEATDEMREHDNAFFDED